jgi:hypothetical protein
MRDRLIETASRYGTPDTLRVVYILLVLAAVAVAGGAPVTYGGGH